MAKRIATSELNHDNWNVEDDPEEAGTFQKASSTDISRRTVVKAKRRIANTDSSPAPGNEGKTAFSGFTGFSSKPVSSANYSPSTSEKSYNFCSNSTTTHTVSASAFGGGKTSTSLSSATGLVAPLAANSSLRNGFNWASSNKEGESESNKQNTNTTESPAKRAEGNVAKQSDEQQNKDELVKSGRKAEQLHQLKVLNESVTVWIEQHVDRNPYCILTPIFRDYDKYVKELELDKAVKEDTSKLLNVESSHSKSSNIVPQPFTFAASKIGDIPSTDNSGKLEDEEGEYKPPVNEVQPVQEENSVYSKRCKLLFKKDGNYVEKGIGMLHLKPSMAKTQLVIRADTNLGNILLNILVSSNIPVQKIGNNNVMLICVPNPPIDKLEGPIPFLIRVKTSGDADELIAQLDKAKSDQR